MRVKKNGVLAIKTIIAALRRKTADILIATFRFLAT
jgi:hypothetical protein